MIPNKKLFSMGVIMLLAFLIVLAVIFSPVFPGGQNGLNYLDALYNSISKGSAYYIPKVKAETDKFFGQPVILTLDMKDKKVAEQTALLFEKTEATAKILDTKLEISGGLGKILAGCLNDADSMYNNDGQAISAKYGYDARQALFNWWKACGEMDKDLKRQEKFKEAQVVDMLKTKAVETAYNYYKIEAQNISDRLGVVIFSLVFYVVYTLWYGFAILYLFEGWGLQLEGH